MDLKLKKMIKEGRLFYLIADNQKNDTYYEYYEYPNFKQTPIIETVCYKTIGNELLKAYKNRDYTSQSFRSLLFLLHGIIIDGNVIDIASSKELADLIDNIRYRDLYNVINSFRKKLSIEVLEFFKNKILEIEVIALSNITQTLFNQFCNAINYTKDKNSLFKEVLFLAISNEYNRAYLKVLNKEQEILDYEEKVKANPEIEDEFDTTDEDNK